MNKKAIGMIVGGLIVLGIIGSAGNEEQVVQEEDNTTTQEQQVDTQEQKEAEEKAKKEAEEEAKLDKAVLEHFKVNPPYVYASFLDDGTVFGGAVHMDNECWGYKKKALGHTLNLYSGYANEEVFGEATFCPICCPYRLPNDKLSEIYNK